MSQIAKVVVEISLDREFDYLIPASLQATIGVGSQVQVPFHGRDLRGFVVGITDRSAHEDRLKEIAGVVGERPLIPDHVMKLAYWIADYYCSPIEHAVRTVLPSAVRRRGAQHKKQLEVSLLNPDGVGSSALQKKVVELLRERGPMRLRDLKAELGCSDSPIRTLDKNEIVAIEPVAQLRDPLAGMELVRTEPFALMDGQQEALNTIHKAVAATPRETVLLQGVTGSGKTEVYLQAIQSTLDRGEGAIVLVPEIALTPQTVERFRARFGAGVAVLHSGLSDGERHDEWHRIRDGQARIAVGARSALFAPIESLGLIVVDEEHEPTYKQEESPRYHARDAAVMRGRLEGCCVVLGSATPSLESSRNVQSGRYLLARMDDRVDHRAMPLIRVIDMVAEAERNGQPSLFSSALIEGLYDRLDRGEQVMLFLNRRGFSSSIQCESCGYVNECSACSVTRNYHKAARRLLCHICGSEESLPDRCPCCGQAPFKFAGSGTEKMEEILGKLCPRARIARMDSDTMRRKEAYQEVLDRFRSGQIDILLGTQMIAKGLDFPNVTLVGVLNADIQLHVPDFRAGERTYQLLTQVAGRAGRGDVPGEVLIQTYTPHHPAIQAAQKMDASIYLEEDLTFRKQMNYPPFAHLVLITFKGLVEAEVASQLELFMARLSPLLPETVQVAPPMPAPLARAKGFYRYQVMLRCEHTVKMTKPVKHALGMTRLPLGIKVTVDVDASSLL
jgi:primosomal protein N' (replication factor Y)